MKTNLNKLQKKIDYILLQETTESLEDWLSKHRNQVPIHKGCPNVVCFCTGACREIIGYRNKLPGEN